MTDLHTYSDALCTVCHPHPEQGGACIARPPELTEIQMLRAELAGVKDAAGLLGKWVREKNDEIRALRGGAAPAMPRVGTYEPTPSEIRRRAGLEHGSAVALLLAHAPVEFIEYFTAIPWTAYVHGPACLGECRYGCGGMFVALPADHVRRTG